MAPAFRGAAIAIAAIAAVVALGSTAAAQVSVAVEPRAGVSIPDDDFGASVFGGIQVGFITPSGGWFGVDVSKTSAARHGQATSGILPASQSYDLRQSETDDAVVFGYYRSLDDNTQLRVGGGLLVRALSLAETTEPASQFQSSNVQLGIEGLVALERRLGVGSVVLDARLVGGWTPPSCANKSCGANPASPLTGTDHTTWLVQLGAGYEIELGDSSRDRRRRQTERRASRMHEQQLPALADPSAHAQLLYKQGVAAAAREDCAVARAVADELRGLDTGTYQAYLRDAGVVECLP